MRETLFHVTEPLTRDRREALCRTLAPYGAGCETRQQSKKPQFIFITYDERRASPRRLIEALSRQGLTVRLVDV